MLFLLVSLQNQAQFSYPYTSGQFEGLSNFMYDNSLKVLLHKNHVRSVTEIDERPTYSVVTGTYYFDTLGGMDVMMRSSGNFKGYYKNGHMVKNERFNKGDTSKVESWEEIEYDSLGRMLKNEAYFYREGTLQTQVQKETKLLSQTATVSKYKEIHYGGSKIYTESYITDSTAGPMHYTITYTYRPDDVDAKGRKKGKKELERRYVKDNCMYEDEVKYDVVGKIEIPDEIKTHYYQNDAKGKLTEFGELDYEKAMYEYISLHPEEFQYGTLPPKLVTAILQGNLKGERDVKIKQVYGPDGLMQEQKHYSSMYRFKYNAKGQLIERRGLQNGVEGDPLKFSYYDNGLIKETSILIKPNDYGPGGLNRTRYVYTYYK